MLHTALPNDVRWSSLRSDKKSLDSDDHSLSYVVDLRYSCARYLTEMPRAIVSMRYIALGI